MNASFVPQTVMPLSMPTQTLTRFVSVLAASLFCMGAALAEAAWRRVYRQSRFSLGRGGFQAADLLEFEEPELKNVDMQKLFS